MAITAVMRGLDPRIHLLAKMMDCRVKPGNDNGEIRVSNEARHALILATKASDTSKLA